MQVFSAKFNLYLQAQYKIKQKEIKWRGATTRPSSSRMNLQMGAFKYKNKLKFWEWVILLAFKLESHSRSRQQWWQIQIHFELGISRPEFDNFQQFSKMSQRVFGGKILSSSCHRQQNLESKWSGYSGDRAHQSPHLFDHFRFGNYYYEKLVNLIYFHV